MPPSCGAEKIVRLETIFDFLNSLRSHYKREIDDEIKWLNMNPKPSKRLELHGDIVFLSEIIANSMYWQVTLTQW